MEIGLLTNAFWAGMSVLDMAEEGIQAEKSGFDSYWVEQPPLVEANDAMTCLSVIGQSTRNIKLGVAVMPFMPRHPIVMAQQALTTSLMCGGRFSLGLGPAHKMFMVDMYGLDYERVAKQTEEYVAVMKSLFEQQSTVFTGEYHRIDTSAFSMNLDLPKPGEQGYEHVVEAPVAPPIYLGAMGPMMLKVAGRYADGIVPGCAGAKIVEDYFIPKLTAAATEAGRAVPKISLPVPISLVPGNMIDEAKEFIDRRIGVVLALPPYARMLEQQNIQNISDLAIIGDEETIRAGLARLRDLGVDEVIAQIPPVTAELYEQTERFVASLVSEF